MHLKQRLRAIIFFGIVLYTCTSALSQLPARHKEGLVHGFLTLRTMEGDVIADGDLIQNVHGDLVTSRLVFHFKDGSLHDDTAVFSQRGKFRLVSEHLIQRGPSFPHPLELTLNAAKGQVTVRYQEDSSEKTATQNGALPPDLANGIILTLLKNIRPDAPETKLPMLVATPKPRMVTLKISSQGEEAFKTGDAERKAAHFVVKVDIGGLTGALAELFGKEPADTHVWILEGEAPAFVKFEGPLAPGAPSWRIELADPVWPRATSNPKNQK